MLEISKSMNEHCLHIAIIFLPWYGLVSWSVAWSHSFQRTVIGWLRQSLRWWPSCPLFSISLYHQPTLSDLYQTSIGIHPSISLSSPTIILIITITNQSHTTLTAAHLGPHRLCTCSRSHSITTHTTHSRGHEFGHHMASQGFESASFSKHRSMILLHHVPFYYHMFYFITPFMFMSAYM